MTNRLRKKMTKPSIVRRWERVTSPSEVSDSAQLHSVGSRAALQLQERGEGWWWW